MRCADMLMPIQLHGAGKKNSPPLTGARIFGKDSEPGHEKCDFIACSFCRRDLTL